MSSGRSVMWLSTINKIFTNDSIYQLFIGFGPGHYAFKVPHGFETEPHSQYLLFLYEYGLIIFSIVSVYLVRSYTRLKWKWGKCSSNILTLKTVYLYVLLTFLVEGLVYQTQLILIMSVLFALITNYKSILNNREVLDI
jgi:hypothetical protein